MQLTFLIVWVPSAYNAVLGWPKLNALRAIVSTYYLLVRFSTKKGFREVQADQILVQQYFLATIKGKRLAKTLSIEDHGEDSKEARSQPVEQLVVVPFGDDLSRTIQLREQLMLDFWD